MLLAWIRYVETKDKLGRDRFLVDALDYMNDQGELARRVNQFFADNYFAAFLKDDEREDPLIAERAVVELQA
jgi:hypothetical protein